MLFLVLVDLGFPRGEQLEMSQLKSQSILKNFREKMTHRESSSRCNAFKTVNQYTLMHRDTRLSIHSVAQEK